MFIPSLVVRSLAIAASLLVCWLPSGTEAQTVVAQVDFDGNDVNLIGGFDPALDSLDGGGGDYFGVASLGNWPQGFPPGVPFSIADDSFESISNPANDPFPGDLEGIYGSGADLLNNFFAISDTREWTTKEPLSASWFLDISSAGNDAMQLSIDLGQQSNGDSFGGITAASFLVEYSIDGAPFVTAISVTPADAIAAGFQYRAMDSGNVPPAASALQAANPLGTITKLSGETGQAAMDTFLDKTPNRDSPNTGKLDTFVVDLNGNGSIIEVRVTCFVDFEAMVFDNIKILTGTDFVRGDANGDGAVDFGDIDPFLLALFDPAAYALQFPDIDPNVVLDFDGDNNFSFGDIDGFLAVLFGG